MINLPRPKSFIFIYIYAIYFPFISFASPNLKGLIKNIKTAFIESDFNVGIKTPYFFQNQAFGTLPSYGFNKSSNEHGVIRIDNFNLNFGLGPLDLFQNKIPISLSFNVGSIIQYYSLHPTTKLAYAFKPFDLMRLPLRANYAKNHFKENHLVRFYAGLNLAINATLAGSFFGAFIPASASGYYILSGQYKIQIQGLANQRIRVRISTVKNTGFGGEVGVGLSYTLIPVDWIDKFTKDNIFYWDFAKASTEGTYLNQHIIDYIYNLNDPQAQLAYNQLISKLGFVKKNIKFINRNNFRQMGNSVILNSIFSPILSDKYAQEDKDKPYDQRRVIRLFEVDESATVTQIRRNFGLGIFTNIWGITQKIRYVEFNSQDQLNSRFFNPTYLKDTTRHFSFNLFDNYSFRAQAALWDIKKSEFLGLGIFYLKRSHFINKYRLYKMRKHLFRNLSSSHFNIIPWSEEVSLKNLSTLKGPKNGRLLFEVFISTLGMEYIYNQNYSKQDINTLFEKYWTDLKKSKARNVKKLLPSIGKNNMLKHLYFIFKNKGTNFQKEYLRLELNPFFVKYGIGFLMSLLPENQKDFYTIYVKLAGFKQQNYSFNFGNEKIAQYWNKLFDLNFDLTLPSPKLEDLCTLHLDNPPYLR